jgi:hypothetical protein
MGLIPSLSARLPFSAVRPIRPPACRQVGTLPASMPHLRSLVSLTSRLDARSPCMVCRCEWARDYGEPVPPHAAMVALTGATTRRAWWNLAGGPN